MNNDQKRRVMFLNINEKVRLTIDFINNVLKKENIKNKVTLEELEINLRNFLKFRGTESLYINLHKFTSSIDSAGEETDYNLITKYKVNGKYWSLFDCIEDIRTALDDYNEFIRIENSASR